MKNLLLLFGFLFIYRLTDAQIVNIEGERYTTDTTGWRGNYNLGFTFGKQKVKYFAFSNTAHVQYKSAKSLYLLLGSVDLLKTSNEEFVNSGFFHFRYNYKIRNWLRWEAFTQIQYNKLNGIRLRYLLGTGPRFKVVQIEKFKTYIGTLYMMEYEVNKDRTQKLLQGRFSGYLSFSFRPIKTVEIVSTTYYQPKFEDMKDYRISTDNSLSFRFHKLLSFGINYRLNFDSRPPKGAATNLTYQLENKFKIDF
jgi:hypothetical protein